MPPFDPLFRNPHLQTIAGHFWKRPKTLPEFPMERRLIRTEPGVQVLVCSQRPRGEPRGEIVMIHGLEGSGEAGYIESLSAGRCARASLPTVSTCAPAANTEHLCETLYHAIDQRPARCYASSAAQAVPVSGGILAGRKCRAEAGGEWERRASTCRAFAGLRWLDLVPAPVCRAGQPFYEGRFVRRMRPPLCRRALPEARSGLRRGDCSRRRFTAPPLASATPQLLSDAIRHRLPG